MWPLCDKQITMKLRDTVNNAAMRSENKEAMDMDTPSPSMKDAELVCLSHPPLVEKKASARTRSEVWAYFAYIAGEDGQPTDTEKPVCKRCYKSLHCKAGNTSNLAKHLADNHPDLYNELKTRQKKKQIHSTSSKNKPTQATTIISVLERQRKYGKDSKEAQRLNKAVAEYICMDQVPVYTVEKTGFRNLVQQLDRKYDMPGRYYFVYTEIPTLYTEIRRVVEAQLVEVPFFACTTDLWTSRATDAFMALTIHFITEEWEMQSWCLGCTALYTDHTADSLHEAFEESLTEDWKLDISKMSGLTTDNASNNIRAFEEYSWVPCFGHNLHLAVNKALDIDRVAACLSRLRKTVSAFCRSNKMSRSLKEKQKALHIPEHKLIHDEPTRWNSIYDMVERFCEQQQAVCAVLAENRKKWYLMPKDNDVTILETVRDVLAPMSDFTDALSGEKDPTLSSVLPLTWKIYACASEEESDSILAREMKQRVIDDMKKRYQSKKLQLILNTATYLDPRFKDSFVSIQDEVKEELLQRASILQLPASCGAEQKDEEEHAVAQVPKKKKNDLKSLLANIVTEKRGSASAGGSVCTEDTSSDKSPTAMLCNDFFLYKQMKEISPEEDPLAWWRRNAPSLPVLAHFAKAYLCIPASSCASERVFSTSGLICSPRRMRLNEDHINKLVFLAKNLKQAKKFPTAA
ncbi:E3 SUMO-protein ligase ZBED1-like [Bufo gargarizans]|uniref:E3 SUMO-protein ligase ZBED1-like n=1 Tax=Bufo gargarizans TaxID=30331 RepID=UPI001CF39F8E|nr:E3 SUMO-protein ligase ZBED1-like [Bufo gargarizans]